MDGGEEEPRRGNGIAAKERGEGEEGEWGGELVGTRLCLYNAEGFP
jgi:hypothetical protein